MFCTQCGSKIEDGFKFCPECGNAIGESQNQKDNRTDLEKIADEICEKYPKGNKCTNNQFADAIKEFRVRTGCGFFEARRIMHLGICGTTYDEARAKQKEEHRRINREANENLANAWNRVSSAFGDAKEVRCPRCRSTSISYGQKPSIGGAAVGYGLAGGAGAVVGGMTGKKGYAVCLKCGKRWKV